MARTATKTKLPPTPEPAPARRGRPPAASAPRNPPAEAARPPAQSSRALAPRTASTEVGAPVDMESMAGVGFERVTSSDIIIPRLTILQGLSPQLVKSKPEYIKGASVGQFCDTGTQQAFDSVTLIPVYFARIYLEWAPRSEGRGLVKNHGTDAGILQHTTRDDENNRDVLDNGNYIVETATFYCLRIDGDDVQKCFVPMSSTQLRAARRWMTLLTSEKVTGKNGKRFTPPMFYRSWHASTVETSNAKGSWSSWKFEAGDTIFELDPSNRLYQQAVDFHSQASTGLASGDVSTMHGDDIEPGANSGTM